MARLKPIQRFREDVREGDLIMFVFVNGKEKTGYYTGRNLPIDSNCLLLEMSTRWPKGRRHTVGMEGGVRVDYGFKVGYEKSPKNNDPNVRIRGYEILRRRWK